MTITVTTLGTQASKVGGTPTINVSGLSEGDTIVVALAAGTTITKMLLRDSSDNLIRSGDVRKNANFASNIVVDLTIFDYLSSDDAAVITKIVGTAGYSSGDEYVCAAYKISGLHKKISYPVTGTDVIFSLKSTVAPRVGVKFSPMPACTISSITVKMYKVGNPSGTAYLRLRKKSDDSIIGTFGSKNVADLTTDTAGENVVFNTSVANDVTQSTYLMLEHDTGGDNSNYVGIRGKLISFTPLNNLGTITPVKYTGSYVLDSTQGSLPVAQSGLQVFSLLDKSATSTGTSNNPSSGASGQTAAPNEALIGVVATEGPVEDTAGTWGTDIDQNLQRDGTTGGVADTNSTLSMAIETVSATGSYTASKTGITSRDWGAIVLTLDDGSVNDANASVSAYMIGGTSSSKSAYILGCSDNRAALYPDEDISETGDWKNDANGDVLYSALNAGSATYVYRSGVAVSDKFKVGLPAAGAYTGISLIYIEWSGEILTSRVLSAKIELYSSTTLIKSDTRTFSEAGSLWQIPLTQAEIDSITNWNDLSLIVTVTSIT